MPDLLNRLFIVCGTCGQTDHMDPDEWRPGGEGHYVFHGHLAAGCPKERIAVALVPVREINEFYRLDIEGRIALMTGTDT